MPKGEFYELYQDYVCSCVLRVAREVFSLLPIDRVLIHAVDDLLNGSTGHVQEQTILSTLVMKEAFLKLNLEHIDPSSAMKNFIHNMDFKKSSGFSPVEPVLFKHEGQAIDAS